MAKNKKLPKTAIDRPDKKQARAKELPPEDKPSWRFSSVDKAGPFAWPVGLDKELEIVAKLHGFDSMKWSEIEGSDHHFIPIDSLSKEAKKRLEEKSLDDIDQVFSFHLQGKPRIFCIRDRNVAKLLWYDPDHKVCVSQKKHT